jgi:hypothetical protein
MNISNTQINKDILEDYLSDFHPIKIGELRLKFKDFNFNIGTTSFLLKMTKVIGMPKIGKSALNYWISRGWTLEESKLKRTILKKDPSLSPMNKQFWIKKGFSEEESLFKIKSQRKLNKEYWINKGYSEDESIKLMIDFQKENSLKLKLKLDNDSNLKNSINSKRSNNINYWLNLGYSLEDSKKLLSDRQRTFTLEKCIEKYGEEDGQSVWKKRQEKWNKSLLDNGNLKNGFSKISLELFDSIYDFLNDIDKQYVKYFSKNNELFIKNVDTYLLYDFNLRNKIIEFNGDVYHGNPNLFKENDICINYKNNPIIAKDVWNKDRIKIDLAISNGFDVLTIWESEYKKDKKLILERCLEFLKIDRKIYEN